jgi:hypothetical protein
MSRTTETCPTCGSKLDPNRTRAKGRVCSACHKANPPGFDYCGFCASPMETTEHRARILEMAAPPGGWPNLTSELVEVRFYLQQGLFDDAYELLSILQRRYPGHPQLVDLARKPKSSTRVDTDVLALVDAVLAESVNLVAKVPRRQAPKWQAPSAPGPDRTAVHSTVASAKGEKADARPASAKPPTKPNRTVPREPPKSTTTGKQRHASAPTAKTGGQKASAPPRPTTASTTKAKSGAQTPVVKRPPAAAPPKGRTELYKVGDAPLHAGAQPPSPNTGHTMVVDALQPPAPFEPPADETPKRGARAGRKRPAEEQAPTPAPASAREDGDEAPRKRRVAFGEHVLNRLR